MRRKKKEEREEDQEKERKRCATRDASPARQLVSYHKSSRRKLISRLGRQLPPPSPPCSVVSSYYAWLSKKADMILIWNNVIHTRKHFKEEFPSIFPWQLNAKYFQAWLEANLITAVRMTASYPPLPPLPYPGESVTCFPSLPFSAEISLWHAQNYQWQTCLDCQTNMRPHSVSHQS